MSELITYHRKPKKAPVDSLLRWLPRFARNVPDHIPRTVIPDVNPNWWSELYDPKTHGVQPCAREVDERCYRAADLLGYPLFVRTDVASGKHSWKKSCFVPSQDLLDPHIREVVSFNDNADMMGLEYTVLLFREYIPLHSTFTAFWGDMPVSRERRYFVHNNTVFCHHPYWVKEAINRPSIDTWERELAKLNAESKAEIKLLTDLVERAMNGIMIPSSVDLAYTKDKRWIVIDAATASHSWHPETCKHYEYFMSPKPKM